MWPGKERGYATTIEDCATIHHQSTTVPTTRMDGRWVHIDAVVGWPGVGAGYSIQQLQNHGKSGLGTVEKCRKIFAECHCCM